MPAPNGSYRISVTATSRVPIDVVYKHLEVAEAWNEWGRFPSKAFREREGEETPNGIGAIRKIKPAREEVVAYDPPHHYAYVALSGLPVRSYRADVHLEDHLEDTLIRWEAEFEPRYRGTGPIMRVFIRRMLARFARRVAEHTEFCEPGCPARLPEEPHTA